MFQEKKLSSSTHAASKNSNFRGQRGHFGNSRSQRGQRTSQNVIDDQGQRGGYRGKFNNKGRNNRWDGRSKGYQQRQNQNEEDNNNSSTFIVSTTKNVNITQSNKCSNRDISFLLDSGSSTHIINDDTYYFNSQMLEKPVIVYLGDGRSLHATKIGLIKVNFYVNNKMSLVTIENAYFVKNMKENLLSFGTTTKNYNIITSNGSCKIYCNIKRKLIAIAKLRSDNILEIKGSIVENNNLININTYKN